MSYIITQNIIKKLNNKKIIKIRIRDFYIYNIIVNNILIYDNYDFIKFKFIEYLNSRKIQRDINITF